MTNKNLAEQAEEILNELIGRGNKQLENARNEIQEFKLDCINLRMMAEDMEKVEL